MKPFGVLVGPERRPAAVIAVLPDVDVAYVIVRAKPDPGETTGRIRIATTRAERLEVIPRYSTADHPLAVFFGAEEYVAAEAARDAKEGAK